MKRIAILAFSDGDVYDGLRRLIALNPGAKLLIPWTGLPKFTESVQKVLTEYDLKVKYSLYADQLVGGDNYHVNNAVEVLIHKKPNLEIARTVTSEDIVAIVWDDSEHSKIAVQSFEDLAVEIWNINEGLEVIEVDYDLDEDEESDMLYEEMQETLSNFIEAFSMYIMHGVVNTLSKAVEERLREDADKKDINPF
jgi:hypothetical protein